MGWFIKTPSDSRCGPPLIHLGQRTPRADRGEPRRALLSELGGFLFGGPPAPLLAAFPAGMAGRRGRPAGREVKEAGYRVAREHLRGIAAAVGKAD